MTANIGFLRIFERSLISRGDLNERRLTRRLRVNIILRVSNENSRTLGRRTTGRNGTRGRRKKKTVIKSSSGSNNFRLGQKKKQEKKNITPKTVYGAAVLISIRAPARRVLTLFYCVRRDGRLYWTPSS